MSNLQIVGETSLYFVPLLFEKEVVQSILPQWLKLMPPPGIAAAKHPMMFSFAHERRVRLQWGIFSSPGSEFKEVGVGAPYVQLAGTGQGPFYSYPKIYLDSLLAIIAGKFWWGFEKIRAEIQTEAEDSFYAVIVQNRLLLSGEFKPCGASGKPSDFPFFEDMRRQKMLVELPVVDKTFWGSYSCAKFDLDWDKIVIQPVEAKVQITDAVIPGLQMGEYTVKGINEIPLGALHLRAPWTMSMPMKCTAEKMTQPQGNSKEGKGGAKNPELQRLERQAREQVDQVRDNPEGRYQLRQTFYQKYGFAREGGSGYGHAELAFMRWAIERGVLNPLNDSGQVGSPWWRAMNEEYLYFSELAGLLYQAGRDEADLGEPLKFWLAYFQAPSSITWYRAHNATIVQGYLNQLETATEENRPEQIFMNIVLYRVLYAQAMVEGNPIALGPAGHILADPRLDAVDIMVHLPRFYPNHYPLSQEDIDDIVKGHCLEGIMVDVMDDFFIIQHLPELYHLAAGWLKTSQLECFISGGKCVYPALVVSA